VQEHAPQDEVCKKKSAQELHPKKLRTIRTSS
jgi:hypothetical protein